MGVLLSCFKREHIIDYSETEPLNIDRRLEGYNDRINNSMDLVSNMENRLNLFEKDMSKDVKKFKIDSNRNMKELAFRIEYLEKRLEAIGNALNGSILQEAFDE